MHVRNSLAAVFLMLTVGLSGAHAGDLSISERATLKALLLKLSDGEYRDHKPSPGIVASLKDAQVKQLHPVILVENDMEYVLCADFVTPAGEILLVDYFVQRTDEGYRLTDITIGERSMLAHLLRVFM